MAGHPIARTTIHYLGDAPGAALTAEFSAPSAGAPPWHAYRITVRAATALSTVEPGGATSWRF